MRYAFLFLLLAIWQCQPSGSSSQEAGEQQDSPQDVASRGLDAAPEVSLVTFICHTLMDENENPNSQVFIQINQQRVKIADIQACDVITPDSYGRYEIPETAIAACGGWWAGAGDYFYALREGDIIRVMKGWQDEGQEDQGFHYESVREIDLKTLK
jgi:hypothetical protein